MPTTRRSTGGTRARPGPAKGQSTISFSNKVTKPVPRDIKNSIVVPSVQKIDAPAKEEPEVKEVHTAADKVEEPEEVEEEGEEEAIDEVEVPEKTDVEIRAENISDAAIGRYWKSIEGERLAPRLHQEGLSLNEKVLRYFDVSSQYGVSNKHHIIYI